MYKCICGADLKYLNSEVDVEGIIEFYQCDNCKKIIAVSDIEEEEFLCLKRLKIVTMSSMY